jgi:hypothetical protein
MAARPPLVLPFQDELPLFWKNIEIAVGHGGVDLHDLNLIGGGRMLAASPTREFPELIQAEPAASLVPRTALLASWALEQQGDGGRRDSPRRRIQDGRRPRAPKLNPTCPFPQRDAPGVAFPPRIPRQVPRRLSPRLFTLERKRVMLVVCVVLCPLCGWMPLNRLRSRAE